MSQKRILSFDLLRIIAIIAVIAIHASFPPLYTLRTNPYSWWISNIVESLLRWTVPVYFMLSGALLLTKEEPISIIFTRRLPKIIIPFIFWSQIYILLSMLQDKHKQYLPLLYKSISGPAYYHLWFVYTLIGLYLITPFVRYLIKAGGKSATEYFLVLWFLFGSFFPLLNKLFHFNIGISVPFVDGYIGYFVLGYYLYTYNIPSRIRNIPYFLTYLSWLIVILGTYALTVPTGNYDDYFHKYLAVPVVLNSIAVFIFFQNLKLSEKGTIAWLNTHVNLGRICYGIYLSHLAVMYYLGNGTLGIKLNGSYIHPIIGIVATTAITFAICFTFFYLIERMNRNIIIKRISAVLY